MPPQNRGSFWPAKFMWNQEESLLVRGGGRSPAWLVIIKKEKSAEKLTGGENEFGGGFLKF
jgi:hypothetical protein